MTIRPRDWPLGVILSTIFALGVALIALPEVWLWDWAKRPVHEFGTALVIAALLGASVDVWMRKRLARDAFEGAIGYVLPTELRDEVQRIARYEWVCIKQDLHVRIERETDEIAKVTFSCERVLKNITNMTQDREGSLAIDDWGYEKPSQILELEISAGGTTKRMTECDVKPTENGRRAVIGPLPVAPGETFTVCWQGMEYKRANDEWSCNFGVPAVAPSIVVHADTSYTSSAGFKNSNATDKQRYAPVYTLRGTYLPDQIVSVRWRPKGR